MTANNNTIENIDGEEQNHDRVAKVMTASRMYIQSLLADENDAFPVAERAERILEGFLDALALLCPDNETGPDRARWSSSVRLAMREILEALRNTDQNEPGTVAPTVLARAIAETIRWELVDRHAPDAELWIWLGDLFTAEYGDEVLQVHGKNPTVAREYLRALAYHAALLDQQSLRTGFAIAQLIDLSLPDLLLVREHMETSLYSIDIAQGSRPKRMARTSAFAGWSFVTVQAADKLSDIHGELIRGQHPEGLATIHPDALRTAILHLCRQWSSSPPTRRFQRHPLNTRLSVIHGYEETINLLADATEAVAKGTGAWRITDMSQSGIGATTPRAATEGAPLAGDLVAFCPEEGTRWHIGVVRRVRTSATHVEIGIATLSTSPGLANVDDGRGLRALCVCDPVRIGEVVRLVGPVGVLENNAPLFVTTPDFVIHKLRPLTNALRGKSFDLRLYQVT